MQAVAAAHPFYRARLRDWNIKADDIRSVDDLQALPLTRKEDFSADPEAFRLRADDLPVDFSAEERTLWDVVYTTGTTSRPAPFFNTAHDAYAVWDHARRCNEAEGLRFGDRVANLYPLANFPTGAFFSVVRSAMMLGIPVVHGLTGSANSEFKVRNSLGGALEKVESFRPTALWGVPSFLRRFLDEAQKHNADFSQVRLVITSGEPMPAALRREMRGQLARLGASAVDIRARYAFTEMQGGLVQCADAAPPQNLGSDLYYLETVDPQSGRRLPDGDSGMLAITHLHRRGTVLLRYLVGDVVALSRGPCPFCGREGERLLATPRRTGNLVKCRGMLVNTDVVLDTVSALAGAGECQIVFTREDRGMDRMTIRLERNGTEDGNADAASLRERLAKSVQQAVSLRPEIEFVARGALYDHERSIKTRRVIDLRTPVE
jgi:phenylacetate-coenzyme A ligase PaaK-like adenylate-forming protein